MDDWVISLTGLLEAVAAGKSGQADTVIVCPPNLRPDLRFSVNLLADEKGIVVTDGEIVKRFEAGHAAEAVSYYAALVEGNS